MKRAATWPFPSARVQHEATRLGMWVFLATEGLLFAPLILAYVHGRIAFAPAFAMASRHTDLLWGTINTALLLTSSWCMALAVETRREPSLRTSRTLLVATAVLGCAFLAVKVGEWRHDWSMGWFPGAQFHFDDAPASERGGVEYFFLCYFAATGLHALHLAIGIGLVLTAAGRAARTSARTCESIGLFWHFVDVLWIFLFPALYLVGRSG